MPKKTIIPILTFILILSCFKKTEGLRQSDIPILINQFLDMHVQYHSLNDKISERILKNYLNILDYGKYYFYRDDIDEFMKHKHMMDDYIANDKYHYIYKIFSRYKKRFNENMELVDKLIKKKYDFNKDEKIIIDRDRVDYARNKNEMKDRLRKTIKLQLLNYISAGKNINESKAKLKKKYTLLKKRIDEIDKGILLEKFINACTTALDPHSNYLTEDENEDFKISMELKLEGIGVRLRSEDGFVIVESIIPGGATDKLPEEIKLKPSDKIVAVAQYDGEPVDVIDMDLREVVKKIRGKKGTEVRLTILRETNNSDKPRRMIVPIIREEIKLQDSDAESDIYNYNKNGYIEKIGYIKLPSFYYDPARGKTSTTDVKLHISKLLNKGARAIVLDLRGNPGGLLHEAVQITGLFIDNGPVVQIKDRTNPPMIKYDNDGIVFYKGPLLLLIDKFSASASEILAGAIKDYRRGLIIGPGNTFGKGSVQSYNELHFMKGAIKVTTHIFYQPAGTSNQLGGIKPNIVIPALSSIWDIGEDKTRYPLKWKKINKANFKPYNNVNLKIISALKNKSSQRINSSEKFRELIKKINKFKKQINNKTISLKEESTIEKQKEKELRKNLYKEKSRKIIDLETDIFLKEAFNITSDYLKVMRSMGISR